MQVTECPSVQMNLWTLHFMRSADDSRKVEPSTGACGLSLALVLPFR